MNKIINNKDNNKFLLKPNIFVNHIMTNRNIQKVVKRDFFKTKWLRNIILLCFSNC